MTGESGERSVTVITHARPEETRAALVALADLAVEHGFVVRLDPEETLKHRPEHPGILADAPLVRDAWLCVALGGDGTILRGLRSYCGTGVPVFAVNFGEVGFLSTVEPDALPGAFALALEHDFDLLRLPAIELDAPGGRRLAINDVSIHRKVGERVAELAYAVGGEEVGSVRCDGLVVATPAGSTGYNLANGGPVMAWGVEGMVVSFIAPHSLSARALVIAPGDVLTLHNCSQGALDVSVDGRPAGEIAPGGRMDTRFVDDVGTLAQWHGSSFYRRLREKFGRLSR
ncbi:MAG: kinase [Solirubrobacteraceae bacterium]|nr:kinase [Solirubrobacteraceae bacterium]MEA2355693.1 kinase [Solirubrobacteraceae bacterium]